MWDDESFPTNGEAWSGGDDSWVRFDKPMVGTASLATVEASAIRVQLLRRRVERVAECSVQLDRHALYLATWNTLNDTVDEFAGGPRFESGPRNLPTATVLPRDHELRAVARGEGETEYVAVFLDQAIFDEVLASSGQPANRLEILPVARSRNPFLLAAGARLKHELGSEDPYRRIAIELICQDLALHLLRFHSNLRIASDDPHYGPQDARIARARDFIHANLDRTMTLEEIAVAAGMSRFHFARCFRQALGDPPHRYVLKQRIELAKILLGEPSISIAEIALKCGFSDQGHFGRRFKASTGLTPRAYRDRAKHK